MDTFVQVALEIADCALKHIDKMKEMEAKHIGDRSFLINADQYVQVETYARVLMQTAYDVADRARTAYGDDAGDTVTQALDDHFEGKVPEHFRH